MMLRRIFLDTNVLLAASLSPDNITASALLVALDGPYEVIVSNDVINEYLDKKTCSKFRKKEQVMTEFLDDIRPSLIVVETPKDPVPEECFIADGDDQPILRAALSVNADVFVSGDNHFLNARSQINTIEIISPQEFFKRILGR